jgi:tripeptide aminopeptidase
MNIVDRFLKYVSFCTTSDENTGMTPSTPGQMEFAQYLADELKSIGLTDVSLDSNGYIMATLPATEEGHPVIGFIAHMDTSPDASGRNVKTSIVKAEERDYIDARYKGQDVIVTDTTTLLGADDKAGIAEIVTAMEYLMQHPEIKHGKVRIGFTPDEEIGRGADRFDIKGFGADFAYTVDGDALGELEYECFNAASCVVKITGISIHPGNAKNQMINASLVAMEFAGMLPPWERPEHTEGYEGFYHLKEMTGNEEKAELRYILRDHDRNKLEAKKAMMNTACEVLNKRYGAGTVVLELKDTYRNMKEIVEQYPDILERAKGAFTANGIEPTVQPIRGGTDGALLSFKGLPCPNLSTGGYNFHGRKELIPVPAMEKMVEVLVTLISL